MPDFGQRCADLLWQARSRDSMKLTRADVARIINQEFAMVQPALELTLASAKKERDGSNIPPTPAEVESYGQKIGWPVDGAAFCDHYERKGWRVDGRRMNNWKAQLRTAKRIGYAYGARITGSADQGDRVQIDRSYDRF